MTDELLLSPRERAVDLRRLIELIKGSHFSGVPLVEPQRSHLLILIAQLSKVSAVCVDDIIRFFPPILEGLAEDREEFRANLVAQANRVAMTPQRAAVRGEDQESADAVEGDEKPSAGPAGRRGIAKLIIIFVVIPLLLGMLYSLFFGARQEAPAPAIPVEVTRSAEKQLEALKAQNQPPRPAQTAQGPAPRATREQAEGLVRATGPRAYSAFEHEGRTPQLGWLRTAAQRASWPANLPLPLHNREFVGRMLGEGGTPASRGGARAGPELQAAADAIVSKASGSTTTVTWRAIQAAFSGRALEMIAFLIRNGGDQAHYRDLAAVTRRQAAATGTRLEASDEDIARAWAVGTYDIGARISLSDAPWDPPPAAAPPPAPQNRSINKLIAGILVIIATLMAIYFVQNSPLSLATLWARQALLSLVAGRADARPKPDSDWLGRWRRTLGRPYPGEKVIDLDATVSATAAANGFADFRYRLQRTMPSFNVALERRSTRDSFAAWWMRLFEHLRRAGLNLRVLTFQQTAAAMPGRPRRYASPAATHAEVSERLIIWGRASSSLKQLEHEVLAAPTVEVPPSGSPPETLRPRDADLARLQDALAQLADDLPPTPLSAGYIFGGNRNWLDETPIDDRDWRKLRGALILQLGADGYRWLAGCSLLPGFDDAFLMDVAGCLGLQDDAVELRQLGSRLVATPWLRAGRIPQWMRARLQADLGPDDAGALSAMLAERLRSGEPGSNAADGVAGIAKANETPEVHLEDDRLLAEFIAEQRGLFHSSDLPSRFHRRLLPSIRERLTLRKALCFLLPLGLAATIFYLIPPLPTDIREYVILAAMAGMALFVLTICWTLYWVELNDHWGWARESGIVQLASMAFGRAIYGRRAAQLSLDPESDRGSSQAPEPSLLRELQEIGEQGFRSGLRALVWVAFIGVSALCCYLLNLRVAAERADVARIERRIVSAMQAIRQLQTEVATRSRIAQLEEWNETLFGLAAPAMGQYVSGREALDRISGRAGAAPAQAPR